MHNGLSPSVTAAPHRLAPSAHVPSYRPIYAGDKRIYDYRIIAESVMLPPVGIARVQIPIHAKNPFIFTNEHPDSGVEVRPKG